MKTIDKAIRSMEYEIMANEKTRAELDEKLEWYKMVKEKDPAAMVRTVGRIEMWVGKIGQAECNYVKVIDVGIQSLRAVPCFKWKEFVMASSRKSCAETGDIGMVVGLEGMVGDSTKLAGHMLEVLFRGE